MAAGPDFQPGRPLNTTLPNLLACVRVEALIPPTDNLARPLAAPAFSTILSDGTISTTITYEYDNLYRLTKTTYSSVHLRFPP
jgi:hypothetical protein